MSGSCQVINVTRTVRVLHRYIVPPSQNMRLLSNVATLSPRISSTFHNLCIRTALLKYTVNYTSCIDIFYCNNSLQPGVKISRLPFLGSIHHQLTIVVHAINNTPALYVETSELHALLQNINNDNCSRG
jgi:hypothetical protein